MVFNITIPLAFLGGLLAIFTPCVLALLPSYFAITFKEKYRLLRMVLFFAIGLAITLGLLGITISVLGYIFSGYIGSVTLLVGVIFIILGIFSLSGLSFSNRAVRYRTREDPAGVLLFGMAFGLGGIVVSPCNGPILLGIAGIAMLEGVSGIAMFSAYVIGLITPLLLLSYFFDRYDAVEKVSRIFSHRMTIAGRKFSLTIPNLVAGIIFLVLGSLFVIYQNTAFLSSFFTDLIPNIVVSLPYYNNFEVNLISSLLLTFLLVFIAYLFYKSMKRKEQLIT